MSEPWKDWYFIDDDKKVHLRAAKCPNCGEVMFPKRKVCARCLHEPMDSITLSNEGIVAIATKVHQGPKGFETPYYCGYVDFPEKVRVYGLFKKYGPEGPQIHDRVATSEGVIFTENEQPVMGYIFEVLKD